RFYRYYTKKGLKLREVGNNGESEKVTLSLFYGVFKEAWLSMLNVFLVFFVTLAVFPAVLTNTPLFPPGKDQDFIIHLLHEKKIYVLVTTFLNFNVFAVIGNSIANLVQWPSPKYLWMVVFPRLFFIPIFLFCNYGGSNRSSTFPVLIENEWSFIVLIALMSLSHGYLSSLSMMYAPKAVDESKARIAGMMSAFFLVLGITLGINFTFIESHIFVVTQ
uniref:Equilibrative nucleoside transporter 1 n=1 Tax=Acrobeloides nanus TaxID=290746 RepID=A0A914D7S0_9BILA